MPYVLEYLQQNGKDYRPAAMFPDRESVARWVAIRERIGDDVVIGENLLNGQETVLMFVSSKWSPVGPYAILHAC